MYLTNGEEKALAGEKGEALEIAYRVLVALGKLSNAKRLIPIEWAHVSGVSYLTIGEYGLEFLRKISSVKGSKFKVFTTVNPCGMDIEKWDELKIPADYAEKQLKIISYYEKLGIANSFTCVPFQSYKVPRRGTAVAWAESSAAIYANSILGLHTNRESAVSALAAALTGKTVFSDLHLPENRKPTKNIRVHMKKKEGLSGSVDFGVLGYFAGREVPGVIGFQGLKPNISLPEAKALCAAIGTVGSSGMFVNNSKSDVETIDFTEHEYANTIGDLSDASDGDLIVFGCPQMTTEELYELSKSLLGKTLKKKCVVFCSSRVYEMAQTRGYAQVIESAGATFVRDACADFTPLISALHVGSVETDSCKGAHYMKKVHGVKIALKDMKSILAESAS
ncbi:MAG: aconitase X catalytic domain-containing protein [Thaumarchaeota archaeon]|nr:aconitase X catalytic domain-containing protein [Nitrososphaerota archaeon]MDG6907460.1 aconitase X catalytic domain-containing protein [Nitrososphaerota archaeon]